MILFCICQRESVDDSVKNIKFTLTVTKIPPALRVLETMDCTFDETMPPDERCVFGTI